MVKVGQTVRFITDEDIMLFRQEFDPTIHNGEVSFVNEDNHWFLVTYDNGFGTKLKKSFFFRDIGHQVRVCDDNRPFTREDLHNYEFEKITGVRASGLDRVLKLSEYLAEKLKIMKQLGVTPTDKEWNHVTSLDSEIAIDQAIRTIIKNRWAKRKYKS